MNDYRYPSIIAHRGSSIEAYENSFAAFQLAISQKADMIELDTHITKDGHFIVYHDGIIKLDEEEYVISKTKLETIQQLSLPNGDPIPILDDVLKQFLPSISFNVEIKCPITKKQFEDMLERIGVDSSKIIVSSFLFEVINTLKDMTLGYSLAFLYVLPTAKNKKISNLDYVSAMNPFHKLLNSKQVQYYHKNSKKVYPWTIDREKDIRKLIKKRVDGIITNKPKETRDIINGILKV